ncbi:MAG: endonuclease/exonuclease/phosphatase family protein [Bacteroidales bacterium]|nr:endonuclease/exonuclease/phosphatase family protein [Bacteroidales bacterium]
MLILAVPYLLLAMLLAAAVLLVCRRKWTALFLAVSALVLNSSFHVFALHPRHGKEGKYKVLTLNVHSGSPDFNADSTAAFILAEDPDLICLSEHIYSRSWNLHAKLRSAGYHCDWNWNEMGYYSKYPISPVREIRRRPDFRDETYICRVAVDGDSLDLCFCHLATNNRKAETFQTFQLDSIHTWKGLFSYISNIPAASRQRGEQASCLCGQTADIPTIVLGDMNDIYGSAALKAFRQNGLRDTWWRRGFGYGATIRHPLPYRIDHILCNDAVQPRTVRRVKTGSLSDHDALVMTFDLTNCE